LHCSACLVFKGSRLLPIRVQADSLLCLGQPQQRVDHGLRLGLATPLPAMSYALPCATDENRIGQPMVSAVVLPGARSFVAFKDRVRAMGIRDRPISFRSPWQNGYGERLIGSIRREHTDHLIVVNAEHLRRILVKYSRYYNEVRTHVSLGKDAPYTRQIERFGEIVAHPILGGLHHRYARI